jgi:hypothetical protein
MTLHSHSGRILLAVMLKLVPAVVGPSFEVISSSAPQGR